LFRVELHGVISQYLGETASKLAKVFEHVRDLPGVYLFDEFDALGGDRSMSGGEAAGAEMRRVVNSLLQFIEDDRSDSLIVAATNHAQLLDPAIFRRFDESIAFEPLAMAELVELTRRKLDGFEVPLLDYEAIHASVPILGHADLCVALDRVRKDHVLEGALIDTARVTAEVARRMRPEAST
jgi:SpoVK/Ycf46/Vps4 family AAA+-type ATPase